MAGERIRLEVSPRERLGSRETRRLRKQGLIPGVIYGRGKEPAAICVPERELRRALTAEHGLHAILDVVIGGDGAARPSILKDYQRDPVRGLVTHIDLQEVRLDRPIQSAVVVELVGESHGAKEGGVLSQVTREVQIEALPMEMPDRLELDVTALGVGESFRVADLTIPGNATILDDPDTVLATVTLPTRVEEPEEMGEEGEEGAEVPTGEEAPEGGSEAPLEPDADAAGEPGTVEG